MLDVCGEWGDQACGLHQSCGSLEHVHVLMTGRVFLDCNGVCGGDGVLDVCGICDETEPFWSADEDIPGGDCAAMATSSMNVCVGSGIPDGTVTATATSL